MSSKVVKTYHIIRAALFGAALLFWNCEETDTKALGELNRDFADRTIVDAFLTYKDSGMVRMELKSPLIEEFTLIDSPYTMMRKGVNVKFWNSHNPNPNFLKADWAKVIDKKKFYEGKGNVEMINNDGDTLRTQHIFWDNKNRRIFTQDTVIIKRMDGTINISNKGLEASEDFKEFTFYKNHGVIVMNENGKKKPKTIPKPIKKPKPDKNPKAPKGMIELKPTFDESKQ